MLSFIHWWRTCCTVSHSQYNTVTNSTILHFRKTSANVHSEKFKVDLVTNCPKSESKSSSLESKSFLFKSESKSSSLESKSFLFKSKSKSSSLRSKSFQLKSKSKSSSLRSKSFLFKSESKSKSSKNRLKSGLESKSGLEYYKSGMLVRVLVCYILAACL